MASFFACDWQGWYVLPLFLPDHHFSPLPRGELGVNSRPDSCGTDPPVTRSKGAH